MTHISEIEEMDERYSDLQKLTSGPQETDVVGPIEFIPDMPIWERHPDESAREWVMFSIYRELQPQERSLAAAYRAFLQSMGKPLSTSAEANRPIPRWYTIAKQFRWHERADAFDRFIDEKVQNELIDQRISSRVALAKLGAVLRRKAAEAAVLIQSMAIREGKIRSALTIPEISTLARLAKDLEMSALGISGGSGGSMDLNLNIGVTTAAQDDDEVISKAERILEQRQQLIDAEATLRREAKPTEFIGQ